MKYIPSPASAATIDLLQIVLHIRCMKSYLEQLEAMSSETGVELLHAFKNAGIPTSTFYRTINGVTELRYETARKAMKELEKLHALEQARHHTRKLRQSGARADRRKVRKEFKPRSTSA
jgi:4-diphosphocytidyl-2C-methyl-D-erythritol kinase